MAPGEVDLEQLATRTVASKSSLRQRQDMSKYLKEAEDSIHPGTSCEQKPRFVGDTPSRKSVLYQWVSLADL